MSIVEQQVNALTIKQLQERWPHYSIDHIFDLANQGFFGLYARQEQCKKTIYHVNPQIDELIRVALKRRADLECSLKSMRELKEYFNQRAYLLESFPGYIRLATQKECETLNFNETDSINDLIEAKNTIASPIPPKVNFTKPPVTPQTIEVSLTETLYIPLSHVESFEFLTKENVFKFNLLPGNKILSIQEQKRSGSNNHQSKNVGKHHAQKRIWILKIAIAVVLRKHVSSGKSIAQFVDKIASKSAKKITSFRSVTKEINKWLRPLNEINFEMKDEAENLHGIILAVTFNSQESFSNDVNQFINLVSIQSHIQAMNLCSQPSIEAIKDILLNASTMDLTFD